MSSFGRAPGGASFIRRVITRMPATAITSPTNTIRHVQNVVAAPPISGPTAIADAPAAATMP